MMDLEKLKCCAEAVGRIPIEIETGEIIVPRGGGIYVSGGNFPDLYDPEHNDTQAFELLKDVILKDSSSFELLAMIHDEVIEGGQTLNQAVIEAIWEVKK